MSAHSNSSKSSNISAAIVFLLGFTPIFATVLYGAVDSGALTLLSIFASLTVMFWAIDAWRRGEFAYNPSSLQIPVLAIGLIGLIQLLPIGGSVIPNDLLNIPAKSSLSLDPYATRFFLMRLAIYFIFFAAALNFIDSEGRVKKITITIIGFGGVIAFFSIMQWLAKLDGIYGLRAPAQAIPFGTFVNQHHFAALMEMTSGLTFGLIFGRTFRRSHLLLLLIAVVPMAIAVFLTGSRGGLLSFAGVFAFAALANFFIKNADDSEPSTGLRNHIGIYAVGLALIFIVFGLVLFLGGGESLLRGTGVQSGQGDFTSGRSYYWQIALEIFRQNPIIGTGLDSFGVAFTRFDTTSGFFRVEQAHNDYLQMLTDAGVLGFACVIAFIYLLFKKSISSIGSSSNRFERSVRIGALAGCFGILIHSFFDFPLRTPANSFFFLMLVVIATLQIGWRSQNRTSVIL